MDEHKQSGNDSPSSLKQVSFSPSEDSESNSPNSHASSPRADMSGADSHAATSAEEQQQQQQQQREPPATVHSPPPEQQSAPLSEPVRTLKEAFPDVDVEIIEAILASQNGQMERSFEILLGMSDPDYKPEAPARPQQQQQQRATNQLPAEEMQPEEEDDVLAPPMPPRPTRTNSQNNVNSNNAPYSHWGQQQQQQPQPQQEPAAPRTVEEQLAMDEAYARQLALEDERARAQQYQRQRQQEEDDRPLFNFQEDLPVIKERVLEAGNAAKKKVLDLYSQFKANRAINAGGVSGSGQGSIPTTNVQYRGLPSDDGDDLLAGDVSALHLSDNDVYAQTRSNQTGVIQVNPPYPRSGNKNNSNSTSSPVNAQILADEELARRLARDDRFWDDSAQASLETRAPQMPPRRTPPPGAQSRAVDSDLEGDSVQLNAPDTRPASEIGVPPEEKKSYVIQDEDDSDDDDLIDVDDDDRLDNPSSEQKPDEKPATSPK